MNLPHRILAVTSQPYLPQVVSGADWSTHELLDRCRDAGCAVACAAGLAAHAPLTLRSRFSAHLHHTDASVDSKMGYPVFRAWSARHSLTQAIAEFRPTVAMIFGGERIALLHDLPPGLPAVVYFRDAEFRRNGGEPPQGLNGVYLAVSGFVAAEARRQFGIESTVIPSVVTRERYAVESSRDHIVFVNPHPHKGVDIAFALAEARLAVRFLFVESWTLMPDARREYLARAKPLRNLTWWRSVKDARRFYGKARALLVPSRWQEAYGRVVTESQISAVPTLGSNRGGLPEAIGPGGIVLDPDAPLSDWVSALDRLVDDPAEYERLAELALQHSLRTEVDPERITQLFMQVLAAL